MARRTSTLSLPSPSSFSSGGLSLPDPTGGPAAPKRKVKAKKRLSQTTLPDPQGLLKQKGLTDEERKTIRKGLQVQADRARQMKAAGIKTDTPQANLEGNYHPDPLLEQQLVPKPLQAFTKDIAPAVEGIPFAAINTARALGNDAIDTAHGHPTLKRTATIAKAVGEGFKQDVEHPLRHPLFTISDLWGGAGALGKVLTKTALVKAAAEGTAASDLPSAMAKLGPEDNRALSTLHQHRSGQPVGDLTPPQLKNIVAPSPRLNDVLTKHEGLAQARQTFIKDNADAIKQALPGVWKQPRPRNAGDVATDVKRALFNADINKPRTVEAGTPGELFNQTYHPPVSRNPIRAQVQYLKDKRGWTAERAAKEQAQISRVERYIDPKPFAVKPKGKLFEGGKVDVGAIADAVNSPFRAALLYLKPAYIVNLAQNIATAGTTQGVHLPRNLWDALHLGGQLSPEDQVRVVNLMHEGASRSFDVNTGPLQGPIHKAATFWNNLTDKVPRISTFLHEARRNGFNTPEKMNMLLNDPKLRPKLIELTRTANKEIVDFGDLNKFERDWVKRAMFFYPWTKAAIAYSARFPLEHPVQQAAYLQAGAYAHAQQKKLIGAGHLPSWMATYMDLGHGNNPWMANTMNVNTFYTPVQAAQGVVGLAQGGDPHASELAGQLGPFSGTIYALLSGQDTLGRPFDKPKDGSTLGKFMGSRVYGAAKNLATMIPPVAAYERATRSSGIKKGGTEQALLAWLGGASLGGPVDLTKAKTSGEAEYTKTLSSQQKIVYKGQKALQTLPQEVAAMKAKGIDIPDQFVGQVKGDYELSVMRDEWIEKAARHLGVSPRSMTPQQKLQVTIDFMTSHNLGDSNALAQVSGAMSQLSDTDIRRINRALMQSTGIGVFVSKWKSLVKKAGVGAKK
jgi:hypothetical protein